MSKGRRITPIELFAELGYTPERVRGLERATPDEIAALVQAGTQHPATVRLDDGRLLTKQPTNGHAAYRCLDGMVVMVSDDPGPHGTLRHVSVSYAKKDPRWYDLKLIRKAFFATDVDVMQVLPRAGRYVNAHPHCFHLWQMPEAWQGDTWA